MPRLNVSATFEPVVVPGSTDYESYQTDLDAGRIGSFDELEARLATRAGSLVRINGTLVRETRQVTAEQREQLLAEGRVFEDIRQSTQAARDYASYFSDIASGNISTADELRARFATRPGSFVSDARGTTLRQNGSLVRESRQIDADQQRTLLEVKRVVDTADQTISRQRDTLSYLEDIATGAIESISELNTRFTTVPGGFVRDSRGNALRREGNLVRESRQVTAEQQEYLRAQSAAKTAVDSFVRNARDEKSYLDDITSGRIRTREELQARLTTETGRLVSDTRGALLRINGETVRETREVSPQFAADVLKYYDSLATLDASMRSVVADILAGIDDANAGNREMKARAASALNETDFRQISAAAATVFDISRLVASARLRAEVARNIVASPEDIRENFELFSAFGLGDESDRRMVQDLNRITYDARRLAFSRRVLDGLSRATTTDQYSAIIAEIAAFSQSPFDADAAASLELRGIAYERELASETKGLIAQLDPVRYTPEDFQTYKGGLTVRPGFGDFDYLARLRALFNEVQTIVPATRAAALDIAVFELTNGFRNRRARDVLGAISELDADEDTELREQLLAFYRQYVLSRRNSRPDDYAEAFQFEISALRTVIAPSYDFDQGLDNNVAAFTQLARRFKRSLAPLLQALRGEGRMGASLESYFAPGNGNDPRTRYTLDIERIERQRPLSERERQYLASVELLSLLNPHLIALANEAPAITSVYLESFFAEQSDETFARIIDGDYVPLLQFGLGPNGMNAVGETLRSRPDLAEQALYIDAAALPGGPFAVPKGAAWGLNSANANQIAELVIANPTPEDLDGQTVRDYGSPMRHFPGERTDNDVRQGSINTSTDYLPTADGVTGRRYATNTDEALVLQLQAAVLLNNFSLRTSVVDIVPQPEPGYPDRVVFTLQHTYIDGRREIKRVVTDRWIAGQGSGGPSYGFDLRGSSAEGVLAANAQISGFPKLSDTLTAFTKLASNEQDQPELGEVVVIYGSGNSTDTLLEYIGGLFSGSNRGVRNIRKVYVVATKPLSPRPRYADNKDLQPRAGQALGSLLEFVDARVGDVDFADQRRDTDTKLRLFDTDGNELRDRQGRPIRADNVISAAGFRPDSDPVFARLTGGRSLRDPGVLEAVTLPTNPNITVGDRIAGYNGGLFIGTGSRPGFDVLDKLAQLPPSSREALIRNGAENAVAIGFRGPDTQAAVRLFLDDVPEIVPSSDISAARQRTITQRDIVSAGQTSTFRSAPLASSPAPRRRDIVADSSVLSPLLLRPLADIRFPDAGRQTYRYRIALDANSRQLNITSLTNAPYALVDALAQACTDPYFVTYAQAAQANRRGSTSIDVTLEIRNGRISPRFSFAQPN